MEEQVQKRAGGDRNHGEPEPRAAGERAARARGGAFPGPEPEERGGRPGAVRWARASRCWPDLEAGGPWDTCVLHMSASGLNGSVVRRG